ncbi:MAG: hypothetical protein H7A36_03295 [Chlamydiales bacterium]|nr:hypothetical protein [Chlamydiales bacterium]
MAATGGAGQEGVNRLRALAADASASASSVDRAAGRMLGREVIPIITTDEEESLSQVALNALQKERALEKLPSWASRHIKVHQDLEAQIHEIRKTKGDAGIPLDVLKAYHHSKVAMRKIAQKFDAEVFQKATAKTAAYADSSALTTHVGGSESHEAKSFEQEWETNFALLYSAHQRTDNPETKTHIRFLMANYLAKAAYLNENPGIYVPDEIMKQYCALLQTGQITLGGMYHRSTDLMQPFLGLLEMEGQVGSPKEIAYDMFALNSMDVTQLYPIGFAPAPPLADEEALVEFMVACFEAKGGGFPAEKMDPPMLLDITPEIGQSLVTGGDPDKISEYEGRQEEARGKINAAVAKAAARLQERHTIDHSISNYLKQNLAIVSRAQVTNYIAVMGTYQRIFTEEDFEPAGGSQRDPMRIRFSNLNDHLGDWANHSAILLGAVSLRRAIGDAFADPEKMQFLGRGRVAEYAVEGAVSTIVYPGSTDILNLNVFRSLQRVGQNGTKLGQAVLANGTARLMEKLFHTIPQEKWESIQADPTMREVVQMIMVRLTNHLSTAMTHVNDFRRFSQAVDLANTEMAAILSIFEPFNPASFDADYTRYLQPNFPQGVQPSIVSIGRSAMGIFAGISVAILARNPNAVRVCQENSYYETLAIPGLRHNLQEVLDDPTVEKVDHYNAEFYHNIEVDPQYRRYTKGRVIEDIRQIFARKPATDSLTVTIDGTIDYAASKDIKELLEEFKDEIAAGRLNIVVFRSGQKFDMLGLDNYYGAPYYVVNNGDAKWVEFERLKSDEVFQTDALSQQYFAWMAETGAEITDQYKSAIFDNTRRILDEVPLALLPGNSRQVCVATSDPGVKAPFIDIKITCDDEIEMDDLQRWVHTRFMEIFMEEGRVVYRRGSFGFPFPNITWIEPSMRINPGVDPAEIRLYRQFFEELAAKVETRGLRG